MPLVLPATHKGKEVDIESGPEEKQTPDEKAAAWVRSGVLFCAGVAVWIWPERFFAVLLLLLALMASPTLGPLLLRPVWIPGGPIAAMRRLIARQLAPDSELMVAVKDWIIEFAGSLGLAVLDKQDLWKPKLEEAIAPDSKLMVEVNNFAVRFVGGICTAVLEEKQEWMPPLVETVGEVIPPALSRVMVKKDDWSPALVGLVQDVVPPVLKQVMARHHVWSAGLVQLVGEVVPAVLSSVLSNRNSWTPSLLQFVGDITPQVMRIVLCSREMPVAIAHFLESAGPDLAPAVVKLIDLIISDPQLMASIKKVTDQSVRDEEMLNGIKKVIEDTLKDGHMYRAVGHGVLSAAEHGIGKAKHKAAQAMHLA